MSNSSQSPSKLGTIIHIGAGIGGDLEQYIAEKPEQIVLIEPNAELLPDPERSIATVKETDIVVFNKAVGRKAGEATLYVYNFFDLSSLAQASELKTLYPGLRVVDRPRIEVMTLADVMRQVTLSPSGAHRLVIDAPGSETLLVQAALRLGTIKAFSQIVLRAPYRALFRGAQPAPELVAQLTEAGFLLNDDEPQADDDPDWCIARFERNPFAEALEKQQSELAQAARREQKLQTALTSEKAVIKQLQADMEDLKAQLTEAQDQAEAHAHETQLQRKQHDMALRLQLLARADLDDLQARYVTLQAENART